VFIGVHLLCWFTLSPPLKPQSLTKRILINHIVLVDRNMKNPKLTKDQDVSVTAEFTPRVCLHHPNFTRIKLKQLIDPNWTASQNNASRKLFVRVTGLLMFDSGIFLGEPLTRAANARYTPF